MDTYTNAYAFDQSYDLERQYYEPSIYHPEAPLFTQQELSGFDPALAQMGFADMCWEPQEKTQFFSPEPTGFGYHMNMGYPVDLYETARCFPEQTSFQQPVTPVTPAGSPQYAATPGLLNTAPPAFLLVPVEDSNGQYQYSAYQVPMDDYIQPYQNPGFGSSPTVPSLIASPLTRDAQEEDDEDEDDRSVLPNCGNTELRGMGLYDDTPDLMFCPTPGGCSPVTPHGQIRPTLGKGLVLERSFGLPEKMMMKDEESGEIIEGRLQLDEDEYEAMY